MNVYIHTLGCFKNEVDSFGITTTLKNSGFNVVEDLDKADVIILNTCGFIRPAKEEAINYILRFIEQKKKRGIRLIVTGCLAQRYSKEIFDEFPEVDAIVGLGNIKEFPDIINRILDGDRFIKDGNLNELLKFKLDKPSLVYYLKIADGCNNRCRYCAIPLIRGSLQVRRPEEILEEAESALNKGSKELILIAQDLTSYKYKDYTLADLLKDLNSITGEFWIRLMYLYPSRVDENLVNTIANLDKIVKYIDIPLQHIDNTVLISMGRPDRKVAERAIRFAKEIPDVIIRSSFIIGYPTETQTAFENLLEFLSQERLHRVGFFTYSQEENTPAYELGDPIPDRVKRFRMKKAQILQRKIILDFHKSLIGKRYKVLVENKLDRTIDDCKVFIGRTYMDAPEIDSRVFIKSKEDILGKFVEVTIERLDGYDFWGKFWRE
ncbi:MAG: 30S ribosomal protein S12 methylthiotransferase RimO [bacterium]|nr:30S ribosomal protein S12 methylthiotransferase RimO [bacterium]